MTKDPRVFLAHIIERMDRITAFTAKGRDAFLSDLLIQDAVIRNFADVLPGLREAIGRILPPLDDLERELGGDETPR